jgi:signal transduction histidine kinase
MPRGAQQKIERPWQVGAETTNDRWDFLRTVSHELRTPLTCATGFLDLLSDALETDDAAARRYLALARQGMNSLCERVGELSLAFETTPELHLRFVSIPRLIREAVNRIAESARAKDIALVSVEAPPIRVEADAERLGHALDQVLINAVKYSPAGSRVQVSHELSAEHVAIRVSDEGPGIPHAERSRVFEPFYRSQAARDAAIQGLGLGLTIVQNIAAAHGGSATVADDGCPGTGILLKIPARLAPRSA